MKTYCARLPSGVTIASIVESHLNESAPLLRKRISTLFTEFKDDILDLVQSPELKSFCILERIDWIETKKKEKFFR